MARPLPLLNHPIVLLLRLQPLKLFLLFRPLNFPRIRLVFLNGEHLCIVFSSTTGHITNVLDHQAFNLVEQLQSRFTVDFSAAHFIDRVDRLDLLSERVEHLGDVERVAILAAFARRAVLARLVEHRLRRLLLQCRQDPIVDLQLQLLLISGLRLLIILDLELGLVFFFFLEEQFVDYGHLLLLVDLRQVILFKFLENFHQFVWLREEKFVSVVVTWHIDQAKFHELLESPFPLVMGYLSVDLLPLLVLALSIGDFFLICTSVLAAEVGELHLLIVVNIVIILEHNIKVKLGIGLVLLDPLLLQNFLFSLDLCLSLLVEFFTRELEQELLVRAQGVQGIFVLLDVALDLGNLRIKLLDSFLFL